MRSDEEYIRVGMSRWWFGWRFFLVKLGAALLVGQILYWLAWFLWLRKI